MILGLIALQSPPDLMPVSSWIDGKMLPVSVVRSSPSQVDCMVGEKSLALVFSRSNESVKVTVQPPQDISISFRKVGRSFAARTAPDENRVMQFGSGFPYSRLNNALLSGNQILSVKASDVAVYGGESSGAIRVHFSKPDCSATFVTQSVIEDQSEITDWKNQGSALSAIAKLVPQTVPIPSNLSDEVKTWYATLLGLCGIKIANESLGPLQVVSANPKVYQMDFSDNRDVPEIIVTHVEEQGRQSAWVGLFNQTERPRSFFISPEKIGLASDKSYAATDFWQWRFLGNFAGTLAVTVPPQGCRLIVLKPASEHPDILCSTSQILGQIGTAKFDSKAKSLSGMIPIKGDFLVSCVGTSGNFILPLASLPTRYLQREAHLSAQNPGAWNVRFSNVRPAKATAKPALTSVAGYPWRVTFLKDVVKEKEFIGHYVFKNDQLVAYFADNELFDDDVDPGTQYIYSIVGVTPSGDVSMPEKLVARTEWPLSYALTALFPEQVSPTNWNPRNGFLPDGTRLIENGEFVIGYGLPANSKVTYRISRAFESLQLRIKGDVQFLSNGNPIQFEGDLIDLSQTDKLTIASKTGGVIISPRLSAKPRP